VGARPWGGGKELIREVMQELWSEEKGRESEKEVKRDQEIQELKAREQAMARGLTISSPPTASGSLFECAEDRHGGFRHAD
jgi:hypothetical protein